MKKANVHHLAILGVFIATAIFSDVVRADDYPAAPPSITVQGKTMKLIGKGLREFLFIDIYTMSAYSQSGSCDVQSIVYKDEPKYLRLDILRELSKDRMVSTLKDTLYDNLPKNADESLKNDINKFLSNFKTDLQKGAKVEIIYIPGTGTILKQDGRQLGAPTKGKSFSDILWKSYFGRDTCCSSLKSSILEQCKR